MKNKLLLCLALYCLIFPVHAQNEDWQGNWMDEELNSRPAPMVTDMNGNPMWEDEGEVIDLDNKPHVIRNVSSLIEAAAAFKDGENLPYYMSANQHGVFDPRYGQGYLRGRVTYSSSYKKLHTDVTVDAIVYGDKPSAYYGNQIHLQQAYAKFSAGTFGITFGCKEEEGQFVDPKLSSGNMVFSGNARPNPGIRIAMDDYVPMVFTDNFFEGKFGMTWNRNTDGRFNRDFYDEYEQNYGIFDPDGNLTGFKDARQHAKVENAWMHHKFLFIRTSSKHHFFLTAGIEHATMYGGKVNGKKNMQGGGWLKAAMGGKGHVEQGFYGYNHLMSYDFRMDLNFEKFKMGVYKQHYTDDMEGGLFDSGMDGLWGVEIKLPSFDWFNHIVIEMLSTTNQNGVVYANDKYYCDVETYKEQMFKEAGNSNFYHDEAYGSWTNYGMGIGNPLLSSPIYNRDFYPDYQSNMVRAYHVGISGYLFHKVGYTIKAQHLESWGSPFAPFLETKRNYSLHLELDYTHRQFQIIPSVSMDKDELYGDNLSAKLKLRYYL